MGRRKKQSLTPTDLELAIMQVLWELGEGTVEDLRAPLKKRGRPLAPSSIRTMLAILQDKGYVGRRSEGRSFVYRPVVSAERTRTRLLKEMVQRAFDGSASAMVAALMGSDMVSEKELSRIRKLIEEQEQGS